MIVNRLIPDFDTVFKTAERHQMMNNARSVFGHKSFKAWSAALTMEEAILKEEAKHKVQMPKRPGISASHATKRQGKKMTNQAIVKVTLELPAPEEGYEYTGEWRRIKDINGFSTSGIVPGIKKLPFRAAAGRQYFYLREDFVVETTSEADHEWDRARWNAGNYFETGQAAQDLADMFKETLDRLRS